MFAAKKDILGDLYRIDHLDSWQVCHILDGDVTWYCNLGMSTDSQGNIQIYSRDWLSYYWFPNTNSEIISKYTDDIISRIWICYLGNENKGI